MPSTNHQQRLPFSSFFPSSVKNCENEFVNLCMYTARLCALSSRKAMSSIPSAADIKYVHVKNFTYKKCLVFNCSHVFVLFTKKQLCEIQMKPRSAATLLFMAQSRCVTPQSSVEVIESVLREIKSINNSMCDTL